MTKALWGLVAGLAVMLTLTAAAPSLTSEVTRFLGRFHPSVVHLPIGILLVAILLDVIGRAFGLGSATQAVPLTLLIGAWTAIIAALAGLLLANWGGYPTDTLDWHKRLGIATAVLASIGYALRAAPTKPSGHPWYPAVASFLALGLGVGGHLGGTLTHGEGYLTEQVPTALRPLLGLGPASKLGTLPTGNLDSATAFDALISPILQHRCGNCHNPDRKTGGLSVMSLADLIAGGKNGKVLSPGRSAESDLLTRLSLPPGHPDRMPPDRPIPIAEVELIRWWVDAGAPSDLKLSEIDRPAPIRKVLASYGLDNLASGVFTLKIPSADSVAIATARKRGIVIERLGGNSPFVEVTAIDSVTPAGWDALQSLNTQVAWINLGGTLLDDAAAKRLAGFPHLARLHLERTNVTDLALESLQDLQYLEYLNLYETKVSDSGLKWLTKLKRLRSLYLWKTEVTPAGAESLKVAMPRLSISLGAPPVDSGTR